MFFERQCQRDMVLLLRISIVCSKVFFSNLQKDFIITFFRSLSRKNIFYIVFNNISTYYRFIRDTVVTTTIFFLGMLEYWTYAADINYHEFLFADLRTIFSCVFIVLFCVLLFCLFFYLSSRIWKVDSFWHTWFIKTNTCFFYCAYSEFFPIIWNICIVLLPFDIINCNT